MDLLTHLHPPNHHAPPSFSSTLLDSIYRSIDDSNASSQSDHHHHQRLIFYTHSMSNNHQKVASDAARTKKSMAETKHFMNSAFFNSTSTSSDSSTAGFSSSESDSFYTTTARSTSSSPTYTTLRRPNPIRTTSTAVPAPPEKSRHVMMENTHKAKSDHKREDHGGFVRTKSKAFKIYSDLKKGKQPISPGGRLATFLNSLFTAGNAKKGPKISSSSRAPTNEEQTSTCSSASSFSRSCLSKTPSSRAKSNSNGTKRSVRFCPVSVIVDEDCRPCGHKSLYNQTQFITETNERVDHNQWRVMEENRRVVQAAKDLLKSYRKNKVELDMRDHIISHQKQVTSYDDVEEDEEDDDAASCSSSDLFELDNLSAIGIERYSEDLPVYETTNLGTNRAIANGLIL